MISHTSSSSLQRFQEEEEEEDGRPPQGKRGRDKKVTIETSCRGGIKEEGLLI